MINRSKTHLVVATLTISLVVLALAQATLLAAPAQAWAEAAADSDGAVSSSSAQAATAVAKVGNTEYETLASAIENAGEQDTVILLGNIELSEAVTIEKTVAIDLYGYDITFADCDDECAFDIYGGNLTITDTSDGCGGSVSVGGDMDGCAAVYLEDGSFALEAGKLFSSCGPALWAGSGTSASISGGVVESGCAYSSEDYVYTYGMGCALLVDGGIVTVSNGTIKNENGYAAYFNAGDGVITGGVFTGSSACGAINSDEYNDISITGGTFSSDVSEYCADGYELNKDGQVVQATAKHVAQIVNTDGTEGEAYSDLASAVKAAESGQTVKLLLPVDISETGLAISDKSITLDLNGQALKAANTSVGNIKVYADGSLTLVDSTDIKKNGSGQGKIYTETDYASGTAASGLISVAGQFTMESGCINAVRDDAKSKGQFGVSIYSGSVTIKGGKIEAGWYAVAGNGNTTSKDAVISIEGGQLISTADYSVYQPHAGVTNVSGGIIYGETGGIAANAGTVNVSGGLITSKGQGDTGTWGDGTGNMKNAAINVNAEYADTALNVTGGTITAEGNAVTVKTGSDHNAVVAISGGSFSSAVDKAWCAQGYSPKEIGDGFYGVEPGEEYVACIGTTLYSTLGEAVNAAQDGETVKLLKDVTLTADLGIGYAYPITIDLNGKTINGGSHQVYVQSSGTVTFTGNGTIKNSATENIGNSFPLMVYSGASAVLDGVAVEGVYGVYVYGNLDVKKATVNTQKWAIAVNGSAQVTIGAKDGGNEDVAVTSQTGNCIGTQAANGATGMNVTVNHGTFTSTQVAAWNGGPVYWASHGTLTINGGAFKGQKADGSKESAAVYQKNGTVNINGGTFQDKDAVKVGAEATDCTEITLNITGGEFYGDRSALYFKTTSSGNKCEKYNINVSGGTFKRATSSTTTIYESTVNGVISPTLAISGGQFVDQVAAEYCANGYVPTTEMDAETHLYTVTAGPKFYGATLTLDGRIGVNFYVDMDGVANPESYKMKFTVADETTEAQYDANATNTFGDKTYHRFTCLVDSRQMTEQISAQLYNGDAAASKAYTYSVKTYADNAISKSGDEGLASLMKAMLNYGGYSQANFNYKTDALANANLWANGEDPVPSATVPETYKASASGELPAGISDAGATLVLDSEVSIRLYVKLAEGHQISEYAFTAGGETVQPAASTDPGKGDYYVELPNVSSVQLDEMFEFTVRATGQQEGYTLTYGALSYAYNVTNSTDQGATDALKNVARALYLYSNAAKTYFGN